ncbi:MAG TPA: outer membrane protein assembly factor BamD [Candidatus Angelobacter sp.]|jgi:outer membrane protein assembly factor BamD|nr:outer membrane protein assembly factor BamD [Candidatus Angelobacter sp.]
MVRKILVSAVLAGAVLASSGCHHKTQNPLANIDSKQPDKTLFDRSMESMKKAHYQEARTLLETLINTYPDSEYIARAKLALGDAWYDEGGKAAWQQAESEYKDFQTFFPNLPEASEAQLKIASMHYRQMEKPDRDYAEAQRAADEYRSLIQQYPDSPLVPQAKQKLREVQEVLAERQYRIAHFYYLRDNLAASQARLQSLTESYPLYSGVDEALFELGGLYEKEALGIRKQKIPDAKKEKLVAQFEGKAIEAYSKIITRYPATDRVGDAKRRLEALKAPIPVPTAEALAASKAEEASRDKVKLLAKVTGNFKKRPNVAPSTKVGEPSLEPETLTSAPALVNDLTNQINGTPASQNIGVQAVGTGTGTPGANEKPPGTQDSTPTEGEAPKPAPAQVNEIQKQGPVTQAATTDSQAVPADPKQESSSKKKGKKGLRKLIPF